MNTIKTFEERKEYYNTDKKAWLPLPKNISLKHEDLTKATETYLCHQCNTVTTKAAHLALSVFTSFPYADIYKERAKTKTRDVLGTIIVRGDEKKLQRLVASFIAQRYPSYSKYHNDTKEMRLKWFKQCLETWKDKTNTSFAFAWNTACGSAQGSWDVYLTTLCEFIEQQPSNQIVLYYYVPPPSLPRKCLKKL
jgi:hypothetical protein